MPIPILNIEQEIFTLMVYIQVIRFVGDILLIFHQILEVRTSLTFDQNKNEAKCLFS